MRFMYSCSVVSGCFLGRPFGFVTLIGARWLLLYRSTNFLICVVVNPYFSAIDRCVIPCFFISKTCRMMSFPKCFPTIKNLLPFYPTTGGLFSQCLFSRVQFSMHPFFADTQNSFVYDTLSCTIIGIPGSGNVAISLVPSYASKVTTRLPSPKKVMSIFHVFTPSSAEAGSVYLMF
jgi:hypothetical protein